MSVDLYLDQTATRSKLVIARILGGEGYWPYGLEQFSAATRQSAGVPFASRCPGDDKPDEGLRRVSTVYPTRFGKGCWPVSSRAGRKT